MVPVDNGSHDSNQFDSGLLQEAAMKSECSHFLAQWFFRKKILIFPYTNTCKSVAPPDPRGNCINKLDSALTQATSMSIWILWWSGSLKEV
jgi:hypothetical protein